jgi:phospholipid-binding lipoprotein MlaA
MSRRFPPLSLLRLLVLLLVVGLLGGCATSPGRTSNDDPWQGVNRGIYKFNETIDHAALKPVAKGYRAITPQWFRTGTKNFFNNLKMPWTITNELLQGKPQLMAQDTCRFVFNTIAGLGGVIDVAGKFELNAHDEDFGQTLAVWGVPSGPYLMLPFLGPSTVRDGIGKVPDYFSSPQRYANIPWEAETGLSLLEIVQLRETLLSTEETLGQAYDPYGLIRDAWLQRREYLIFDGNPPEEPAVDDDAQMDTPEDDAADTAAPEAPVSDDSKTPSP